jgi:GTPase SAR1 family protein
MGRSRRNYQPRYSLLRGTKGIFLMYDITNEQSFQDLIKWLTEIERYAPEHVQIIIVGISTQLFLIERQQV